MMYIFKKNRPRTKMDHSQYKQYMIITINDELFITFSKSHGNNPLI